MEPTESVLLLRMLAAVLAGGVLGLDREARGKPAGLRTLMLVALGASLFTIVAVTYDGPGVFDPLRAVQGIAMGVGFLGAGVILRREDEHSVTGLTTAALIWVVAALGIGFALGLWVLTAIALGLAVIVLIVARGVENWLHGRHRVHGERV